MFTRILLIIVIVVGGVWPHGLQAHELQADNSVGAILHVDPDDDPIVGQPASLHFEFKDTAGRFNLASCVCVATLYRDTEKVYNADLVLAPTFRYVFPEKGIYTIMVTGKPKQPGVFTPFTLSYDLLVTREGSAISTPTIRPPSNHKSNFILAGVALLFILLLYLKDRYHRRSKIM